MNFIFFGRLAKEKGFDLLVHSLENIIRKTGELPGNFFVFGEGDLQEMLFQSFGKSPFFEDCSKLSVEKIFEKIEFLNNSPLSFGMGDGGEGFEWEEQKIYFFGWQSQSTIRNVLVASHFSLMPSRFLETFGLSALESLSEGVPVIGFAKWGLIPFVSEECVIPFLSDDRENINALTSKIMEVSEKYSSFSSLVREEVTDWEMLSNASRRIADSYTEGKWIWQVRSILPTNTKRILLASDYATILGGIETHVQTIARTLRQHGYEVEIFGWDIPKGRWTKILRFSGLVYSLCNLTAIFGMRKKIREFQPDAVWLHSVSRFLWPLAVREVNRSGIFSMVTYHDLGLLSPFPSGIESEAMIPKNPSFGAFLGAVHSWNPIVYLAVFCKYLQVSLLRKFLREIDSHIVPSAFLAPHIRDIEEIPEERIVILEHFL